MIKTEGRWRFCSEKMPEFPGPYIVRRQVGSVHGARFIRANARLVCMQDKKIWTSLNRRQKFSNVVMWYEF